MKNLLFISRYPFPVNSGPNQHAYLFLKALTREFNVYCIFFVEAESMYQHYGDKAELSNSGIIKFDICFHERDKKENKYYKAIKKVLAFPYDYMNSATHFQGIQKINSFVKDYSIDTVHFENFHYAKYIFHLPKKTKKVIVYHDLYHLDDWRKIRFEKSHVDKLFLLTNSLKKYIFERLLDRKVDRKIFLNPLEMSRLPKKSIHIPHIVNPEIKYNRPRNNDSFNILFLGGYNHPPNRLSVKYILDNILPVLARSTDKFKIKIIGTGMEKFDAYLKEFRHRKFVEIKGFVGDINKVFEDIDIALFPIRYRGGVKTKVIEAMAAGVPVVTTREGLSGLRNLLENSVAVAKTTDDFIRELVSLMNDYSLRLERSERGRKYVESECSFEVLSHKVQEIYSNI